MKTAEGVYIFESFIYFKSFVLKVSVVTKAKWMDVRLFVQRHCRVCDGTLFGVMCKDRKFILEFVMEWGQCVKLGMVIYRDSCT
jgi:hypothetical protein